MAEELDELYQQVILDHCKKPRNFHALEGANRKGEGYNPLCGDNYTVFLKMDGDVVRDISFQGSGCCISVVLVVGAPEARWERSRTGRNGATNCVRRTET